jgi:acyl-CoA reductase-like NAD-dependent aldehyde dehydrogenase
MSNLKVLDPDSGESYSGPEARKSLFETMNNQVLKSAEKGVETLSGSKTLECEIFFHTPKLGSFQLGQSIYEKRIFSSVANLINVRDENDPFLIANKSCF